MSEYPSGITFADYAGPKEYECKKCNSKIKYAKFFGSDGKIITKDGLDPDGKFGKDTNVFTTSVFPNSERSLHKCYTIEWPKQEPHGKIDSPEPEQKQLIPNESEIIDRSQLDTTPQAKELTLDDLSLGNLKGEVLAECAILWKIEEWITNYLKIKLGGESPNPAKVGMWHKLISERLARSHET